MGENAGEGNRCVQNFEGEIAWNMATLEKEEEVEG
jgi:hypothetical protein